MFVSQVLLSFSYLFICQLRCVLSAGLLKVLAGILKNGNLSSIPVIQFKVDIFFFLCYLAVCTLTGAPREFMGYFKAQLGISYPMQWGKERGEKFKSGKLCWGHDASGNHLPFKNVRMDLKWGSRECHRARLTLRSTCAALVLKKGLGKARGGLK